jgi:hypothetical protein
VGARSGVETSFRQADRAALAAALDTVRHTDTGSVLLDALADGHVRIRVVPDSDYYRARNHSAAASYSYVNDTITIPRSRLHANPVGSGVFLVHEAQHHVDMPFWREAPLRTAAGLVGALSAAMQLRSPAAGFEQGTRRWRNEHEVAAYQVQGALALELDAPNLGSLGLVDGRMATPDEIRDRLSGSASYDREKRRAEVESRPPGSRPPSDPKGSFDGPATQLMLRADGSIGYWGGPRLRDAVAPAAGGAVAGAAMGALLLRSGSPKVLAAGAVVGGALIGGVELLRRSR